MLTGKLTCTLAATSYHLTTGVRHVSKIVIQARIGGVGSEASNADVVRLTVQPRPEIVITPSIGPDNASVRVAGQDGVAGTGIILSPGDTYTFGGASASRQIDISEICVVANSAGDGVNWMAD